MNSYKANDEKVLSLFDKLASEIMVEAKANYKTSGFDEKLWLLPKAMAHYIYDVMTSEEKEKAEHLIRDLRGRSTKLIQELPESAEIKRKLSARLNTASNKFRFRQWSMDDLDAYLSLLNNEEMWRFFPEEYPSPFTRDIAEALINTSNGAPDRHKVHAIELGGEPIGQARIQFDSSADSVEISYWLGQQYWGKGLASDFVALYTSRCFLENTHINRIYAKVIEGNDASQRILEKAGYRYESLEYKNVIKGGTQLSTHVLSVYRDIYL